MHLASSTSTSTTTSSGLSGVSPASDVEEMAVVLDRLVARTVSLAGSTVSLEAVPAVSSLTWAAFSCKESSHANSLAVRSVPRHAWVSNTAAKVLCTVVVGRRTWVEKFPIQATRLGLTRKCLLHNGNSVVTTQPQLAFPAVSFAMHMSTQDSGCSYDTIEVRTSVIGRYWR